MLSSDLFCYATVHFIKGRCVSPYEQTCPCLCGYNQNTSCLEYFTLGYLLPDFIFNFIQTREVSQDPVGLPLFLRIGRNVAYLLGLAGRVVSIYSW